MGDGWRGKPKEFETSGEPRPLVELVGCTTMAGEDVDSLDDATLPDRRTEKASIPVGDPGAQPWSVVREPWNHEVRLLLPHSGSENLRKRQPASVEGKIMMDAVDDVASDEVMQMDYDGILHPALREGGWNHRSHSQWKL